MEGAEALQFSAKAFGSVSETSSRGRHRDPPKDG